jgi:large subunit ribosomal protein L21
MYAIIADGSKQYKVEEGQQLSVEYRDASAGDEVTFDQVLACRSEQGLRLGKPTLDGASVTAEVVGVSLGKKLVVQKFRRRKNSRRKTGCRHVYTRVRVASITV